MMVDNIIDPTTLARLQARAQQTGISTDAMLNQLLDEGARLLVSDVYDLVTIHTIEGAYKYVTPIMQSVLGYTQADSIGKRAVDFVHPDDIDAFREAYNHLLSTGYSRLEYRVRHKDGHYVWFDTVNHLIKDPATGEPIEIIAVSHDISDQIATQNALYEKKWSYELLFQELPIAVWKYDFSGAKTYLQSILATGIDDLEAHLNDHLDTMRICLSKIRVLDGNAVAVAMYQAKSIEEARQRSVELLIVADPMHATSMTALANGRLSFSGEFSTRSFDGKLEHYLIKWVIMPGHEQTADEVSVALVDMTERKNYESSRLENERLVAQFRREREYTRLIQQSISALAHDLRTPLALIGTSKDLLLHYFDKLSDEKRQEKLESIGRQLEFALELIDDTVLSVRGALSDRRFNPAWVNLRKLCAVIVSEIASTTHTEQQLQFINTCPNTEMAWVDDVLVSRILLNLIGNAIKYSPPDTPIQVELLDNELYTTLRVADNGLGIAPDHLPHLFEPFYRASETSNIEGTGLGLSIVKDCVDRHGGMITIESTLGHGTIVTVNLPKGKP